MYNKYKPEKYRVGFSILTNAKYDFIHHIDVYEGKNIANIVIHPSLHNLLTTQKTVANDITKIGIENDPHGYRHLYMYN